MNNNQKKIFDFTKRRDWAKYHNPKDILLGIVEEIGEIRNIIKWEQDRDKIQQVIEKHKDEIEDAVGDIYWFLALLANGADVDIDQAAEKVIAKNEKRFPLEKTKGKHTNLRLGGYDGRDS